MKRRTPQARSPLPFEIDHDLEQSKAFVRLRQAALPVPESFFAVRLGAVFLQVLAGATFFVGVAAAAAAALTGAIEETLGVPGAYVAVPVAVACITFALMLLVAAELLTLQVVIARNTRLTTVILSEMNFAESSAREETARFQRDLLAAATPEPQLSASQPPARPGPEPKATVAPVADPPFGSTPPESRPGTST